MQLSPIVSAATFAALMFVATAAVADPIGEWRVADGTATIRIRHCGAALCGFVATTISPAGKDERNPDPSKRGRSLLGIETLINMRPAGANLWAGTTYKSEDGQIYSAKISMQGEQSLKIEGCAPGGGMCGSETWSRVR
ncbi:MAG: DUF2147 domain-containing protein [Beijerinckiaceae bacterium]